MKSSSLPSTSTVTGTPLSALCPFGRLLREQVRGSQMVWSDCGAALWGEVWTRVGVVIGWEALIHRWPLATGLGKARYYFQNVFKAAAHSFRLSSKIWTCPMHPLGLQTHTTWSPLSPHPHPNVFPRAPFPCQNYQAVTSGQGFIPCHPLQTSCVAEGVVSHRALQGA